METKEQKNDEKVPLPSNGTGTQLVSRDVAEQEVNKWLDYKKVKERKREDFKGQIDTLIDAVADGILHLDKDYNLVHKLQFPTEGEEPVRELKYRPRLQVRMINAQLSGVKADNADGRVMAYAAALTGQVKGVIGALDTEDYSIAQAIVIFFL